MFFVVMGIRPAGHSHFFDYNGVQYCVAVRFLTLFFFLPLIPISGPMLIVDPRPCQYRYRYVPLKTYNGWCFALCIMFAYLRLITLGLICLFKHRATDPNELIASIKLPRAAQDPATPPTPRDSPVTQTCKAHVEPPESSSA
jgi:hypothetical protein